MPTDSLGIEKCIPLARYTQVVATAALVAVRGRPRGSGAPRARAAMSMGSVVTPRRAVASHDEKHPHPLDERHRSSQVTRELDRLTRLLRLAEMRRDMIAMIVVQSRVGRLESAFLKGAVARG